MNGYHVYQSVEKQKRDDLVRQYLPLVYSIARHVLNATAASSLELTDLVQSGVLGLYKAMNKFDERMGNSFGTYASHYVRGAMLDEVRKTSQVPRGLREKQKRVRQAFETLSQSGKHEPTDNELAEFLGISEAQLGEWMIDLGWTSVWSVDALEEAGTFHIEDTSMEAQPENILDEDEQRESLVEALQHLSERDRQVLYAYYQEELTLKEIAYVMDLSESQISRIHSKAILKLRGLLEKRREEFML